MLVSSRLACVAVLVAIALTGCTAAPAALPGPSSTEPAAPEWQPDLTVTRIFDVADGDRSCTILLHMAEQAGVNDALAAQYDAAREFLAAGNWDEVAVSLDDFDADELAARRQQGVSDAELLAMLVQDHIYDDLTAAGLLGEGMSTESKISCVAS